MGCHFRAPVIGGSPATAGDCQKDDSAPVAEPRTSEMSKGPTVDVSAFQNLLAAAWMLQSQHDRELSDRHKEVLGALALAQDPPCSPKVDANPAHSAKAPGNIKLVENAAATVAVGELSPSHGEDKRQEHTAFRDRAVGAKRTLRIAAKYAEPLLVLLAMVAFLIASLLSNIPRLEKRDGVGDPQSVAAKSEGTQADLFAPRTTISHLQITDAQTAAVVGALSRYEIKGLRRQAEYGDDSAALTLGMAYETGYMVPQSCTKAAAWVTIAATEGNAAAQQNLALRYLSGDGVPTNPREAQKWLQAASAKGYGTELAP
jgi:Sel1 repeat